MKKLLSSLALILLIGCSASSDIQKSQNALTYDTLDIKSNLEFLASDELKGRKVGTESEGIAALFIASEFQKYGLKPLPGAVDFFQYFELDKRELDEKSSLEIKTKNEEPLLDLKLYDDFIADNKNPIKSVVERKPIEIVYAGYGINAPEYDYNDYENIDVEGKIALAFWGEPKSSDSSYFKGQQPTHYSNPDQKINAANKQNAAGIIIIPNRRVLPYWEMLKQMTAAPELRYLSKKEKDPAIPAALLSLENSKILLENQGYDLDEILDKDTPPTEMQLDCKAAFNFTEIKDTIRVRNVAGMIEGNDPVLKDEFVTIGAHYDHVGVMGEQVHNGADDNGSGTVGVLKSAKMLSNYKNKKRSILFLLYTGEEAGLLGSKYFTENFSRMEEVIANINLDMVGRKSVDSIMCIGSDRTSDEFHELVEKANQETANFYLDYTMDPRLIYYSDQYHFFKQEIPVVFFFDNMRIDLHKPTDDLDKIKYAKIYKAAKLVENLAVKLSNLDHQLEKKQSVPESTGE